MTEPQQSSSSSGPDRAGAVVDGMADLLGARTSARRPRTGRAIPPTQKPSTKPAYVLPQAPAERPSPPPLSGEERASGDTSTDRQFTAMPGQAAAVSVKVAVYLDEDHELFMEAARSAGATSRPKIDISRSAVVRLAMDRLAAAMSPQQVRDALAAKPVDARGAGRKRR